MVLLAALGGFAARKTPFGRQVYAVGGNEKAAALAGVLYLVVNGDAVTNAIESVITDALSNTPG